MNPTQDNPVPPVPGTAPGQPVNPVAGVDITPAGLPRQPEARFTQFQPGEAGYAPPAQETAAPAPTMAAQPAPMAPTPQIPPPQPAASSVPLPPPPQQAPAAPVISPDVVPPGGQSGKPNTGAVAKPATNPNSTQNTLQIAEIRDGIVIMNDGSFRSVVMVKSINFDLMSPQEQEAVEYSYQGFLNSLYFPIQIFVRSQKVDLHPYIEKLDKIRTEHDNMLLALLIEDYMAYIGNLSEQTNIMDKKFYVVIPYFPVVEDPKAMTQSKNFITGFGGLFNKTPTHIVINEPDLEKAKTELRNRVQATLGGLQQAGIQGLPLDTQELIELYYDTYNPDTATRQQLKNFNDLSADVIMKGQGAAPQAHLQRELQ